MSNTDVRSVPAARIEDLVMTETGDEVLVYDQKTHEIHHLNPSSAAIWRLCDGHRTVSDVASEAGVDQAMVRLALTKLDDAGLLGGRLEAIERMSGQSRRSFLRKAAVAAAVPAIVSVTAPSAAMAGTALCGEPCDASNSHCNGPCSQCGPGSGTGSGTVCCNPGNNPNVLQCASI